MKLLHLLSTKDIVSHILCFHMCNFPLAPSVQNPQEFPFPSLIQKSLSSLAFSLKQFVDTLNVLSVQ